MTAISQKPLEPVYCGFCELMGRKKDAVGEILFWMPSRRFVVAHVCSICVQGSMDDLPGLLMVHLYLDKL